MNRLVALARSGVSLVQQAGLPDAAGRAAVRVAEGAADLVVRGYEGSATQRIARGLPTNPAEGAPTILLFRCLGLIHFSPRFVEALRHRGFRPQTCIFAPHLERRRLLGLQETVAATYEGLLANPPEKVAATVGSSLGGLSSIFVMAPAKVLPPDRRHLIIRRLDRWLPPTPHRSVRTLHELTERLEGARVVVLGDPSNEIELTSFGRLAVGGIEAVRPGLFQWLGRGYLRGTTHKTGLYRELGFDPEEVVDLALIGAAKTWGLHGRGPRSLVANGVMQGGTRLVSKLAVKRLPGEPYDGVVGHRSSLAGRIGEGRGFVLSPQNHIDIMELPEGAEMIARYLKGV